MGGRLQLRGKRESESNRSDGRWTGRRKITWQSNDNKLKWNKKWAHTDMRDLRADQETVNNNKHRPGEDTRTTSIKRSRRLGFELDSIASSMQDRKLLMKWQKDEKPEVWALSPVKKKNKWQN